MHHTVGMRCLQITGERIANLIPLTYRLPGGRFSGGDRAGADHLQERMLDGIIDPQAAKSDAARFAIVQDSTPTGVTRDIMLLAGVANRQLTPAAPAAQKSGQKGGTMLGRAMMSALHSSRSFLRVADAPNPIEVRVLP